MNRADPHRPSDADQVWPELGDALLVADELIAIELTGLIVILAAQLLELLAQSLKHRMVVVQRMP
jgi:hypothetical protein